MFVGKGNRGIGINSPPTTPNPGIPGEKKKCEYCEGNKKIEKTLEWDISIKDVLLKIECQSDYLDELVIKINYCPICGRNLEEEN